MIKRLLAIAIVALAALACSPSDGGASGAPTVAPSVDALPSDTMSAEPSAS